MNEFIIENGTLIKYTGTGGDVIIPDGVEIISSDAFKNCHFLQTVTLPEGLTTIGSKAFSGCKNLQSITLPARVTNSGAGAFAACKISGIWVAKGNPAYCNDEKGVLYNKDKTSLIRVPGGLSGVYKIPEGVTAIGNYAFSGCANLQSITLPEGLTTIGNSAFSGCKRVQSITVPEGVTAIGNYAFSGCTNL